MTDIVKTAAEGLATRIDRRRLFRLGATRLFAGLAIASAGGGLSLLRATTALAYTSYCEPTGPGCPSGCGPSQCCTASGRPSGCNCSNGSGGCLNNGSHCHGNAGTWGGDSCWTCYGSWYSCGSCSCRSYTTCCDCATTSCNDSSGHCISYVQGTQRACPNKPVENIPGLVSAA